MPLIFSTHVHASLNCFTMLEIFSKRCTSLKCVLVTCEITRNVTRSNSTISSAFDEAASSPRWSSRTLTKHTKKIQGETKH